MCYSKDLSLLSYIFGISTSLSLILFGNNIQINLVIGLFYIFVSQMQLIEFFAWSDLLCKNGLNKLSTILGPILNNSQPVILFILTIIYLKSENIINYSIFRLEKVNLRKNKTLV